MDKLGNQSMEKLEYISISKIVTDPNQPRKTFSDESIQELAKSIDTSGLIQPISVRSIGKGNYMIIAGERRFRAISLLKRKEIACLVHSDLNEAQILELQIVENLQREAIDPIEESDSFLILKELGFSIEDIALKVGKSKPFVYQRISLSQLIPEFKNMVKESIIKVSYALKISALDIDRQKHLLNILDGEWESYKVDRYFKEESCDLKYANFDIEKKDIIEGVEACVSCPLNTVNRGNLFSKGKQICTNLECFNKKKSTAFLNLLEKCKKDNIVLVSSNHSFNGGYINDNDLEVKDILVKNGFIPYGYNDGVLIEKPADKISYKEYIKEYGDDWTEEELKEEYTDYLNQLKEDITEWDKALKDEQYLKAIKCSNNTLGAIDNPEILFKIDEQNIGSSEKSISNKKMDECSNEEKIQKIKARETRKKEIEGTKMLHELFDLQKSDTFDYSLIDKELSKTELLTFIFAVIENANWEDKDILKDMLGKKKSFNSLMKTVDFKLFNNFVRYFIQSQVNRYENTSINSSDINKGFFGTLKLLIPDEFKAIESKYRNAEKDREIKIKERINSLK